MFIWSKCGNYTGKKQRRKIPIKEQNFLRLVKTFINQLCMMPNLLVDVSSVTCFVFVVFFADCLPEDQRCETGGGGAAAP